MCPLGATGLSFTNADAKLFYGFEAKFKSERANLSFEVDGTPRRWSKGKVDKVEEYVWSVGRTKDQFYQGGAP